MTDSALLLARALALVAFSGDDDLIRRAVDALPPDVRRAADDLEREAARAVAPARTVIEDPHHTAEEIAARAALWSAWVAEHAAELDAVAGPPMPPAGERTALWVATIQDDLAVAGGPTPEAAWEAAVRWERDRLTRKGEEDPFDDPPDDVEGWIAEQMAAAEYGLVRLSGVDPERLRQFARVDLRVDERYLVEAEEPAPALPPLEIRRDRPRDPEWRVWLEDRGAAMIREAAAVVAPECPGVGGEAMYAVLHPDGLTPWNGGGPSAGAAWRAAVHDYARTLMSAPDCIGGDSPTVADIVAELRRYLASCGLVRLTGTTEALAAWRAAIGGERA